MDKVINITVRNRVAIADPGQHIVCGNEDYTAVFDFDDEWSGIVVKTARFYRGGIYTDVPFHGDTVTIPEMVKVSRVEIGVFAGDMTTTPANVRCYRSILCNGGNVAEPDPDVYARILELINDLQKNGVSDEQIAEAVEKYLTENPIEGGGGQDGVGIKSVSWTNDFKLKLELTDGMTYVSPPLRGSDGVGMPGQDGVSVTHEWNGTVLTVTSASGTSSADLKGEKGANGVGIQSVTQTTTSTADGGANVVTVTKTNGETSTFTVKNGNRGSNGSSVTVESVSESPADGGSNVVTFSDGKTLTVKNGGKGSAGVEGKTPVKGTDYFTEEDKAEMVSDVKNSIDGLDDLIGSGKSEVICTPSLAGYMSVETGAITDGNLTGTVFHTDYLPLEGYSKISAYCYLSSIGYALAFFDSSKKLLPYISIVGTSGTHTNYIDMDVPSEATFCMLSHYGSTNAYIKLLPVKGLRQRMDELEDDMANFVTTSPLKGKTVAVLGDSISSVAYTVPNYWQLIAEKTGCNFLDYGVSGACFAVRSGSTTSFVERATNMAIADAVLVMGGTNDANKNILLGEWASTDNTTLYGALNALITTLRSKYPGRPIIFCTPIKMKGDKDDGFPKTMADLKSASANTNLELWHCALAIKAKCEVHGIPVIDLYHESGIGSQQSSYFRTDDTLHPSDLGECRIANMVQPLLEQQFLYTTEYNDEPLASYTNLVPTSTDTDSSIYNTTGYKDNARLSSSGAVSGSAQTGSVVTGFIPFTVSDIIRMKGAEWLNASANYTGHYYLSFYDSNKTFLGGTSAEGLSNYANAISITYASTTGVTTFDVIESYWNDIASAAYFRINAYGKGADLIITVNQEITD